jgi:site-specific recombinase XerD
VSPFNLIPTGGPVLPAMVTAAGEKAAVRFVDFFTSNIRNPNTRKAYAKAVGEFLAFCQQNGIPNLEAIRPVHVAAYVELMTRTRSAPTTKQHLSAIRMLFDWLVVGQIIPMNPAHVVRGPKHSVRRGKTSVLAPEEARALLDTIDTSTPVGLRDRALVGLMVYSFARIGAAVAMKVEDVFVQRNRLWVRLHEKGGKRHEMPCHHNLAGC